MIKIPTLGLILIALLLAASPAINPLIGIAKSGPASAGELAGLWKARRHVSAEIKGTLFIRQNESGMWAEVAGHKIAADITGRAGNTITFKLPGELGSFKGSFDTRRTKITGHWTQPQTVMTSAMASPVVLTGYGRNAWRGNITPLEETITLYLTVKAREDGSTGAFLRNPERNIGWTQYRIDQIERDGDSLKFLAANKGAEKGRTLADGKYDAERKILTIYLPGRGGSFDLTPVTDDEFTDFYPRGKRTAAYKYNPPPALDDEWPTGTLEEAGLSRSAIEKFIQAIIDTPIDCVNSQEDHGILIARHGKLVLEEYFHGENRDKVHDTRSASKSVAADLMGAAISAGVSIRPSDHVYQIMNGGVFPSDLEPRKRAMTVEHILTMSSGLECDDWNDDSPGFEDRMWEQTAQPDLYKWTMDLKMVREPGAKGAFYCSAGSNLVGGVVARAAKSSTADLFPKLLAEPLGITKYYMIVSPLGDFTFTGGARFLPRDFMKLGQVHLNGGTWKGRRIFTREWSRLATASHVYFETGKAKYGYLWWVNEYPYKGRTITAYFASGNGGQIVMSIPELDMVLAFYGGNYNDRGGFTATRTYVPKYVLPAVEK